MRARVVAAAFGIAAVAVSTVLGASAQATSFRYWSYWTGSSQGWTFATVGPAFRAADERIVEGWRLAVTDVQGTSQPRHDAATLHDEACAEVQPVDGKLRIAVVIDFGTAADALPGDATADMSITCVVVDEGSTGFDALQAAAELRTESGLVCGIDGLPSSGCGRDAVERPDDRNAHPTDAHTQADESPPAASNSSARPTRAAGIRPSQTPSAPATPAAPSSASPSPHATSMRPTPSASPSSASDASPASSTTQGEDDPSGGPFVAGLVLVGLVLLTAMGWLRARRRR